MRYVYLVFFSLLLFLGWIFGVQNSSILSYPVTLNLHLWLMGVESIPIPLGGVVLIAFFTGAAFATLWLINHEIKLRHAIYQKNQAIRKMEQELASLRGHVLDAPEDPGADHRVSA